MFYHTNAAFNSVFLLNYTNDNLTRMAPMREARAGHICGVVICNLGKTEVVIGGGFSSDVWTTQSDTVEIFNIELGVWRKGKRLHGKVAFGKTIAFQVNHIFNLSLSLL